MPFGITLGHAEAHRHQHLRRCPTTGAEFACGSEGMREWERDAGHAGLSAGGAGGPAGMGLDAERCVVRVGAAIAAIARDGCAAATIFGPAAEMPCGAGP